MTQREESVEKLDTESLIVDLLACGLGGVVILFFIFSINIIGSATVRSTSISDGEDKGKNPGFVSMIGDEGKGKNMGAIRIIRLYDLPREMLQRIAAHSSDPSRFWSLYGFKDAPGLLGTVRMQVHKKEREIDFFLCAEGMREVRFELPADLKTELVNSSGPNISIEVIFVEGQSIKGAFTTGMFQKVFTIPANELNHRAIRLKIGRVAKIDRLIEIINN